MSILRFLVSANLFIFCNEKPNFESIVRENFPGLKTYLGNFSKLLERSDYFFMIEMSSKKLELNVNNILMKCLQNSIDECIKRETKSQTPHIVIILRAKTDHRIVSFEQITRTILYLFHDEMLFRVKIPNIQKNETCL